MAATRSRFTSCSQRFPVMAGKYHRRSLDFTWAGNMIRGFNIYSISPVIFFPTVGQICNRDVNGNPIWATGPNGKREVGTCGSFTNFPYNTIEVPGGDTEALANFEYRFPIAGPVTLAYFIDIGDAFILRPSQLKLQPNALSSLTQEFPFFQVPKDHLQPISNLNFRPRSSTG